METHSAQYRWWPGIVTLSAAVVVFALSACDPKLRSNIGEPEDAALTVIDPAPNALAAPPAEAKTLPAAVAPDAPVIPLRRSLQNQAGAILDGEILAKSGDEIAFRRDSDGKMFLIALATLAPDDQLALHELPDAFVDQIESLRPAPAESSRSKNRPPLVTELQSHPSLLAAKAAARESGRPLLVIVTGIPDEEENTDPADPTPVSDPTVARDSCQSLIRTVLGDRGFAGFVNERFEYFYLDLLKKESLSAIEREAGERICWDCGIKDFPAFIVFGPDEEELGRKAGFNGKGPQEVIGTLESFGGVQ